MNAINVTLVVAQSAHLIGGHCNGFVHCLMCGFVVVVASSSSFAVSDHHCGACEARWANGVASSRGVASKLCFACVRAIVLSIRSLIVELFSLLV